MFFNFVQAINLTMRILLRIFIVERARSSSF